ASFQPCRYPDSRAITTTSADVDAGVSSSCWSRNRFPSSRSIVDTNARPASAASLFIRALRGDLDSGHLAHVVAHELRCGRLLLLRERLERDEQRVRNAHRE